MAIMLALLGTVYILGKQPSIPPTQGEYGLSDEDLYNAIVGDGILGSNVLGNMSFEQAVRTDPRRIEALVMQRIFQPLMLAIGRLASPGLPMGQIQSATRIGYLQMLAERRARQALGPDTIAASMIAAWQAASQVLQEAPRNSRYAPIAATLKGVLIANQQDIARAFRESINVCNQAADQALNKEDAAGYLRMGAVLESMCLAIQMYVQYASYTPSSSEPIDAEIGLDVFEAESDKFGRMPGQVETQDLFGAITLDEGLEEEAFGQFEYEEYIVTGHRAPSVALAEYRRMGGRVF